MALVTGAASGIGRAIATSLARRGCQVALADRDEPALASMERELTATGATVSAHPLDVTDRVAIAALPEAVEARHGSLAVLVNNAGVALRGTFAEITATDFDWLMAVNFGGVVAMTRAFLPLLRQSDEARLVNISSISGIIAPPGQTAYCSSKFAVRGFSESLRHELDKTSIGVTVAYPGLVATNIARDARVPPGADRAELERLHQRAKVLPLPPTAAAEKIVRAVEQRRPRIVIGRDARAAALAERLLPVSYWRLLTRLSGAA